MRFIIKSLALSSAILLTGFFIQAFAQQVLQSPKPVPTPTKIRKLIKGFIEATRAIDFDGDKKTDYIVSVRTNKKVNDEVLRYDFWVTSNFRIVKREPKFYADTDRKWFVNLDDDKVPEIVSAYGYEDGIEYSIYKQNFKSKKDTLLLMFNPVLMEDNNPKTFYWGYPWDWTDILTKRKGNYFQLFCSFDHQVEGDFEVVEKPKWQRKIPIIFVRGKSTQPDITVENIGKGQWLDLKVIAVRVRRKK